MQRAAKIGRGHTPTLWQSRMAEETPRTVYSTGEFSIVEEVSCSMTKYRPLVAWEMLLLFASIFVFRSAWTLLDRWDWASSTVGLTALLVLGSGLCVVAFRAINKS